MRACAPFLRRRRRERRARSGRCLGRRRARRRRRDSAPRPRRSRTNTPITSLLGPIQKRGAARRDDGEGRVDLELAVTAGIRAARTASRRARARSRRPGRRGSSSILTPRALAELERRVFARARAPGARPGRSARSAARYTSEPDCEVVDDAFEQAGRGALRRAHRHRSRQPRRRSAEAPTARQGKACRRSRSCDSRVRRESRTTSRRDA